MGWTYLATMWDGTVIDEIPFTTFSYTDRLNAGGDWSASAALNQVDPGTLSPGSTLVWVLDPGGTVRFGGPLWRTSATVTGDDSGTVEVAGTDFTQYLQRCLLPTRLDYSTTPQRPGQVVAAALAAAQAVRWDIPNYESIIDAASGDPVQVDLLPEEFHTLVDVVSKMGERSNGFEWGWRYTGTQAGRNLGVRFVFLPKVGSATDLIFDTGRNITVQSYVCDAVEMANQIWISGSGSGSNKTVGTHADTAALTEFPLLQASTGSKTGSTSSAGLDAEAQTQVDARRKCARRVSFQIYDRNQTVGSFKAGDTVRIILNDGYAEVDDIFRIIDVAVAVDENGKEIVGAQALSDDVAVELVRRQPDLSELLRRQTRAQKELENV